MKSILPLIAFILISALVLGQASPRKTANGNINGVDISVDYGAPSVKGRTVWGGLEPYDKVWRAGANLNTTITFSSDVNVAGKPLPAGKYGFFIIPKKSGAWTVIFNKRNSDWGAFSYDVSQDALRADLAPSKKNEHHEMLHYSISKKGIVFAWEKIALKIPVSKSTGS